MDLNFTAIVTSLVVTGILSSGFYIGYQSQQTFNEFEARKAHVERVRALWHDQCRSNKFGGSPSAFPSSLQIQKQANLPKSLDGSGLCLPGQFKLPFYADSEKKSFTQRDEDPVQSLGEPLLDVTHCPSRGVM